MRLTCRYKGGNGSDLVVEHVVGGFEIKQGHSVVRFESDAAGRFVWILENIEKAALSWLKEEVPEIEPVAGMVADLDVQLVPEAETRLGYAVQIENVAFDLDAIWAVRTFVAEAARQEREGLYASWH